MPKKTVNDGKPWVPTQVKKIETLAKRGITTSDIAENLGRTESAVRTKASEAKISLKPKDK